jgi:hypothetical protein
MKLRGLLVVHPADLVRSISARVLGVGHPKRVSSADFVSAWGLEGDTIDGGGVIVWVSHCSSSDSVRTLYTKYQHDRQTDVINKIDIAPDVQL